MKKLNPLNPEETYVIINKGTELPYTGELNNNKATGTYICRQCDTPLYKSEDKFDSRCGWPSFDDEIEGAIKKVSSLSLVSNKENYTLTGFIESYRNIVNKITKNFKNV